jgi:hypothetical protein
MRDAIIMALKREAVDGEGAPTLNLNIVGHKLVEKAMAGDIQAIKEINDRMDGKCISGEGGEDSAPAILKRIERVIVRPQAKDPGGL